MESPSNTLTDDLLAWRSTNFLSAPLLSSTLVLLRSLPLAAALGATVDFDAKRGTDLMMTLLTYLDHERTRCHGAKLSIHGSTLRYRLHLIAEASRRAPNGHEVRSGSDHWARNPLVRFEVIQPLQWRSLLGQAATGGTGHAPPETAGSRSSSAT